MLQRQKKIACLVLVTSGSNKRWVAEKEFWRSRPVPDNVDVYLLECGDEYVCEETLVPGIYHKTYQGFKKAIKSGYDLYIRTNANTFIDFDRMSYELSRLSVPSEPLYTGGWTFSWGASGTSIILNHSAAVKFVEHGGEDKYYNSKVPDDVVVGMVMRDCGTPVSRVSPLDKAGFNVYVWDWNKSLEQNNRERRRRQCSFVRTKNSKSLEDQLKVKEYLLENGN